MPTTPNSGLPYPAASDAPDVPGSIYSLANALDSAANWKTSGWINYTPSISGPTGNLNASPGFSFTNAAYRFTGGKVRMRVGIVLNGSSAALVGQWNVGLPVAPAVSGRLQAGGQVKGFDISAGIEYILGYSIDVNGSSNLYITVFNGTNGATAVTGPNGPFTWAQNDRLDINIEYDPA